MKTCPLGHTCESCLWQIHLRGINPQTGQEVDEVGCSVAFIPLLLIENAKEQRATGVAIESFRNEMINDNGRLLELATERMLS